jgi:hypothetical protein
VETWEGETWFFFKMGGRTEEFRSGLEEGRANLAREAAEVFQANLPGLAAPARAALSGQWLPGRVAAKAELEAAAPGFAQAFEKSWMGRSLRREEGRVLSAWASLGETYLGYGRPGSPPAEPEDQGELETAETAEAPAAPDSPEPTPADSSLLRILVRRGNSWLLEALTEKDHATYRFEGGEEMIPLVRRMLCASQFSWESLSMPVEALTGERAESAIAARNLPFLKDLRARFRGRILHRSRDSWKREVEAIRG